MDHFHYDVTRTKVSGNCGKDPGKMVVLNVTNMTRVNNELTEEDVVCAVINNLAYMKGNYLLKLPKTIRFIKLKLQILSACLAFTENWVRFAV